MSDIYDQHKAAFANVSAFVILDDQGERVATVALKFPRDGAGRLYAYVHLLGVPMVRAFAGGGGYDKRSAAVASAIAKIHDERSDESPFAEAFRKNLKLFRLATTNMDSGDWTRELERQGFRVLQAV